MKISLLVLAAAFGFVFSETETVEGPPSAFKDDSVSAVSCPAGSIMVTCKPDNSGISDGAKIVNNQCQAFKRTSRPGSVKAVATCLKATLVTGKGYYSGQSVSCPAGATLASCSIRSPWSHGFPTEMKTVKVGNTCSAPPGCKRCQVQAVCL